MFLCLIRADLRDLQHLDHPEVFNANKQQHHPGGQPYGTGSYQGGYQGGHRGGHQGYRGGQVSVQQHSHCSA